MLKDNNNIGIVEDEPQVADLYKTALTTLGMSISFIAGDGLEAIQAFKDSDPKPHIVIMDYRMPIMTGIAAMKEMRKLSPETEYIIVSADSSIREDAIEAGALMFLEKPIQLKQLIGCVKNFSQQSTRPI
jgi:two-component system chemotaxis response regulator CheY